jgi:hypothetical protein
LDSDDGVRETKRTRVENNYSENLENLPECDKRDGDIFRNERDEETGKATKFQRQEAEGKAVGKNGGKIGAADKEISGMAKDSETDKDFSEVDGEDGERDKKVSERVKQESERNSKVREVYEQGSEEDKEGSEEGKEMSDIIKDNADRDASKDDEVVNSCSKRVHEPVGVIEVRKVRISPDMEKQLKLVDGKSSTAEKPQNKGEEKQGPVKSALPKKPKSNLDLAIERVATGMTDEPENTKPPEPARKLNPMPFMRDLHQNLLKKLSRNVSLVASFCFCSCVSL